jgi:Ca-activated chloride channel family protein
MVVRCPWTPDQAVVRTSSRVHADLADRVLRYEVTETFVNLGGRLGEADYVFPLPAGAAFQDLKLSINGELIAGEVLDASQARGVYEEIVRRQRDPALVEWMGSGMLRARIFPIAPHEEKTVVVRFQTIARRDGDALRIDYTRAAVPRPQPWAGPIPTPPLDVPTHPYKEESSPTPYVFTLSYRASDGYGTPYSPTHSLATDRGGELRTVRVEGDAPDVTILLPVPRAGAGAVAVLPYAPGDGPGFALITVAPPVLHAHAIPRDVTFVLDVSGSMSGRKLEQARAAGRDLLGTLTPADRFRLIDFSTDVRTFRDEYESATPQHIRDAERYLGELEADGATNIEGALRRALAPASADDSTREQEGSRRLRLVLFITDGEPTIGQQSPDALVSLAERELGQTRLFTFGLGADVNTSLLEQLALHGKGTAEFVRPDESVERVVSVVAHRLTDPVITDLAVHADGVRLTQVLPENLTDLFAGQDLVLLARYQGDGDARLRFEGRTVDGPISWETRVNFPERARANSFVARLWATQRIGYLEAARHKDGPSAEIDEELKTLGERYGIPTDLTSYLVREPTVAINRPLDAQFGAVPSPASIPDREMSINNRDAVRLESQVVAGVATNAANQFAAAKAASKQRAAVTLAAADSAAALSPVASRSNGAIRHVGDRSFVWRDSVWTDSRFHTGVRTIRVQAFSAAYFAVLRAEPDLRDALALGDRVVVCGRSIAVQVTPAGLTELPDSDVAALQAGW